MYRLNSLNADIQLIVDGTSVSRGSAVESGIDFNQDYQLFAIIEPFKT